MGANRSTWCTCIFSPHKWSFSRYCYTETSFGTSGKLIHWSSRNSVKIQLSSSTKSCLQSRSHAFCSLRQGSRHENTETSSRAVKSFPSDLLLAKSSRCKIGALHFSGGSSRPIPPLLQCRLTSDILHTSLDKDRFFPASPSDDTPYVPATQTETCTLCLAPSQSKNVGMVHSTNANFSMRNGAQEADGRTNHWYACIVLDWIGVTDWISCKTQVLDLKLELDDIALQSTQVVFVVIP